MTAASMIALPAKFPTERRVWVADWEGAPARSATVKTYRLLAGGYIYDLQLADRTMLRDVPESDLLPVLAESNPPLDVVPEPAQGGL